jgi:Transglutaminase-like superfamily
VNGAIPLRWRLRAATACIMLPPLVKFVSLERLARWATHARQRTHDTIDPALLSDWVTAFLHRLPGPWYPTCLRRTVVLYHLLRRAGLGVELWIGVQREAGSGALAAHAWLVRDGEPYLEPDDTAPGHYRVIARFPEHLQNVSR